MDLGKKVIDDFVAECAEVGQIEKPAKLEGRTLTAIIAPKKNNLGGIYHAKNEIT